MTLSEAGIGREKQERTYKRRLLNASSLHSKLRTLGIPVADVAMVDDPGCVYMHLFRMLDIIVISSFPIRWGLLYSYRRGLRSCLSLQGGKFEGQECEISDKYESHAFFVSCIEPTSYTKGPI